MLRFEDTSAALPAADSVHAVLSQLLQDGADDVVPGDVEYADVAPEERM